jgi:hypothetical protein
MGPTIKYDGPRDLKMSIRDCGTYKCIVIKDARDQKFSILIDIDIACLPRSGLIVGGILFPRKYPDSVNKVVVTDDVSVFETHGSTMLVQFPVLALEFECDRGHKLVIENLEPVDLCMAL